MTSLPSFPAPSSACGVIGLLQSGGAFAASVSGALTNVQASIGIVNTLVGTLPNLLTNLEVGIVSSIQAQLTAVLSGAIASLESHIASQLSGLVSNLSVACAHLAAQAGLAGTGGGCTLPSNASNPANDPCFNMSKLFGSLTGGADSFISGMAAQLNMITSIINSISNTVNVVISDVLSGINAAISEINGIASQITTLIASEVAALASVINELLNFASISTLFGLVNNTCAKQVLSAVGTPAMQTALGISP